MDYLPQSEKAVVLSTTRAREMTGSPIRGDVLNLGPMAVYILETSLVSDVVRNEVPINNPLDKSAYPPLGVM